MFDVLTIAALADEMTELLLDGRVQRTGLLDPWSIGLEVYAGRQRRYLVASVDAQQPAVYLSDREPAFDSQLVTPFSLLLRKHVRGGRVIGIEQPPLERVLRFSIAKWPPRARDTAGEQRDEPAPDEDGPNLETEVPDEDDSAAPVYTHLVIEIIGRHSNIILVDDEGRILDSVKRVTPQMSRVRPVLPKLPYEPPPPVDKADPRRITGGEAALILASEPSEMQLAPVLVRRLRAISPLMAREIVWRVAGRPDATVGEVPVERATDLAREIRHVFEEPLLTSAWSPRLYRSADGEIVAFSPIPLHHLRQDSQEEEAPSVARAAELTIAGSTAPIRHLQRRERLAASVREVQARLRARLTSLRDEQAGAAEAERYRRWGELIYAYLWSIVPGQESIEVDGDVIPLDPRLSAKENAQAYFERYRKARGASEQIPALIEQTEQKLAYIEQLLTLIEQAERFEDLEVLEAEWQAYQPGAGERGAQAAQRRLRNRRPRPVVDIRGNQVYVGRSGKENETLTFDIAAPDDTWLHARGVPGSHVIIRWRDSSGGEDEEVIAAAAALAAYYSAARGSGSVAVDVTRRRYVRKIKGAGPGMVTYRNERTIAVRPMSEQDLARIITGAASR
ncbi:MAG: hypothetical protein C4346_06340 [Chloroflexota bacterium]